MTDQENADDGTDESMQKAERGPRLETAVGYKKPPVEHRFAKGQSGNAKGRPRGSQSFKTELAEVIGMNIAVSENGRKTRMSVRKALLVRLRQQALSGDRFAMDKLLKLAIVHLPDEVVREDGKTAEEDRLLLAELKADLRREDSGNGDDDR